MIKKFKQAVKTFLTTLLRIFMYVMGKATDALKSLDEEVL